MVAENIPFDVIVETVIRELSAAGLLSKAPAPLPGTPGPQPAAPRPEIVPSASSKTDLVIDLPDVTTPEARGKTGIGDPQDPEGLQALMNATPARIGQGRAGPRYRTRPWLIFQADAAVTQDTLWRDVNEKLLAEHQLFKVGSRITGGKQEYLLRPDLGRQLNDEARRMLVEKCVKNPKVQICVGDGLSAQAIEENLGQILPVLRQGCQAAGLSLGTPFFIQYCRVGVMNDIGDLLQPEVLMLLIGERPGLGRAESMSVYMAYRPRSGHTDADRDVICNVYNGGTNPLEAGAFAVQLAQKMLARQSSGVKLKLAEK
jgi:ethanolamine ammonia-lyase small subunit